MAVKKFKAIIEKPEKRPGAYVKIPFDVFSTYGTRGQVRVKGKIDKFEFSSNLAPMGGGIHVMGVHKATMQAIGKSHGDTVSIELEQDAEPRVVNIPDDLQKALNKNRKAKAAFEKMSYSHKREYAGYVDEAKKQETRDKRIKQVIEKLIEISEK